MNRKKFLSYTILLTLFLIPIYSTIPAIKVNSTSPLFSLVFKTIIGNRSDYGNLIKQQLAKIGIDLTVISLDWPSFVNEITYNHNYDLFYLDFDVVLGPDISSTTSYYSQNTLSNLFGYDPNMDWDNEKGMGLNEWYLKQGALIMPPDSEARVQHYWAWEQHLMDKLCPMFPTFTPQTYTAYWSNLKGYNITEGLLQSWGKMFWNETHIGQNTIDEVIIADAAWSDLFPFYQDDASSFISRAIMDPLVWYDADMSVWPHLAKRYEYITDTTIEIEVRDGIKWAFDPDGMFPDEYLDIHDVYFTFYAWKYISNDEHNWGWITDMEIIDDWTMRLHVDGDDETPGAQPYVHSLARLNTLVLPEHYLNQTQKPNGDPDVTHLSWQKFSQQGLGTGLFALTNFTEGIETILTIQNDCWWLNETITNDPALDWERRFGFNTIWDTNGAHKLHIKIIPNQQTGLLEFEAGRVDIYEITNFLNKQKEYSATPEISIQNDIGMKLSFVGFNMREDRLTGSRDSAPRDPSITKGLAIRKTISYAINRIEMNNIIHGGEHFITHWPIPPKMGIWCNPNIIRYDYDLYQAKLYLAFAGYDLPDFSITSPIGNLIFIWITTVSFVLIANILFLKKMNKR